MMEIAVQQVEQTEVLAWLTLKFADWLEVPAEELDPAATDFELWVGLN